MDFESPMSHIVDVGVGGRSFQLPQQPYRSCCIENYTYTIFVPSPCLAGITIISLHQGELNKWFISLGHTLIYCITIYTYVYTSICVYNG